MEGRVRVLSSEFIELRIPPVFGGTSEVRTAHQDFLCLGVVSSGLSLEVLAKRQDESFELVAGTIKESWGSNLGAFGYFWASWGGGHGVLGKGSNALVESVLEGQVVIGPCCTYSSLVSIDGVEFEILAHSAGKADRVRLLNSIADGAGTVSGDIGQDRRGGNVVDMGKHDGPGVWEWGRNVLCWGKGSSSLIHGAEGTGLAKGVTEQSVRNGTESTLLWRKEVRTKAVPLRGVDWARGVCM